MRHRLVAVALLPVLATACAGSGGDARVGDDSEAASVRRLSDARLRALDLTYDVPRQVREACSEARRLASVRVVCPRLVPDVPLTRLEGLWGSIVFDAEPRSYMLSFNNGGLPGGKRHWITGGGKVAVVEKWILTDHANEVKGDPTRTQTLVEGGRRLSIYRFPPFPAGGPNGGHFAAFARVGDEIVFASLHGRRHIPAAVELALALAEQIDGRSARAD